MEREWYQFGLRTLFGLMTIVAVACGTYKLVGPPFMPTYREAMQQHYMLNLGWCGVTLVELLVVWLCVRFRRSR